MAYDPTRQLGFWSHLSRQQFDRSIWREISVLYLPSGDRLLSKAYGRSDAQLGASAALLSFECAQPWNRWTMKFDGAASRSPVEALFGAAHPDGLHEPLSYELDWRGLAPIWEMGKQMQEQSWGHTHYEQLCQVRGTIDLAGETLQFDGTGIRDHTRGPRDYQEAVRHIWAHGVFPSGRAFIVIDVIAHGSRISRAVLWDGNEMTEVPVVSPQMLTNVRSGFDAPPFTIQIGDERIDATVLHNCPYGLVSANDVILGFDPASATHCLYEGMTEFTWNGEVGYGLTERLLKLDAAESAKS
jgi:hypothetical protein